MGSKGRPWKTLMVDDYEVRIGRSAAGNDEVTNGLDCTDAWLHVADGYAGAHVGVIKGGTANPSVLRQAARWAAWHSEARDLAQVGVYVVPGDAVVSFGGTARVVWERARPRLTVVPEQPPVPAQPPKGGLHVDPLWSVVVGALRMAVDDHGPIDKTNLSSAAKRVLAAIRGAEKGLAQGDGETP